MGFITFMFMLCHVSTEKGAGVVGTVGKISAFGPQGSWFDSVICATFLSA